MPMKTDSMERKIQSFKDSILDLNHSGVVTDEDYLRVLSIVDVGRAETLPLPLDKSTVQNPTMYVLRDEIPEEIAPPLVEERLATIPDLEPVVDDVAVPDLPPAAEHDLSWGSLHKRDDLNVQDHVLDDGQVAPPELDSALVDTFGYLPKREKKAKKAKKKKNHALSERIDAFDNPMLDGYATKDESVSEEWTAIERPVTDANAIADRFKIKEKDVVIVENKIGDEPMKGCLFMVCIRCTLMIVIKFSSGSVPSAVLPIESETKHGIVMTVCRLCDDKSESKFGYGSDTKHAQQFSDLKINPSLMRGSNIMKVAKLLPNEDVEMVESANDAEEKVATERPSVAAQNGDPEGGADKMDET